MYYTLADNDDGDWFVIPANKCDEFADWVRSDNPVVPVWANAVGSPTAIMFEHWAYC